MGEDMVDGVKRRFGASEVRVESEGVKVGGDGGVRGVREEEGGGVLEGSLGILRVVESVKETNKAKGCQEKESAEWRWRF
jgi:hypothetical protein